jgi:hypothetical protein
MQNFTPVSAAIGGALIGLSVTLLWVADGRIAGISGILGGLGRAGRSDVRWRAAFLVGLMAAPLLYAAVASAPHIVVQSGRGTLILAGLLVGFGTRLGSGCTSGHGVCGIARLSQRSSVATGLFMATALVTVFVMRHLLAG